MKKAALTLTICLVAMASGYAQSMDGIIAQPTHVIGKRINASGEVTSTLEADFTYSEDGKPERFSIPSYSLSTRYDFEGDYFRREMTWHQTGHPMLTEELQYTYEDGKVKTIEHLWSNVHPNKLWLYTYGDDGRLARVDYKLPLYDEDFYVHFLYEYENEGKTKIQNYWTSYPSEGSILRQKNVYQYDDEYHLLTTVIENYNLEGELTSSTLDIHTYTPSGKLDTQITQTLTDGEWVNTSLLHYVYDDAERVVEQQNGIWSVENGDWNINHKVVFEMSEDGSVYIVSFYKKNGDEWVWDVFNNQTIFFGSALANQQRTMRFYQEEEHNGVGNINQFEISLIYTDEPIYLDVEEIGKTKCRVFPNPGRNNLMVEAPIEDAVIRIYNLQGQLMKAYPFDFKTTINTESWSTGMYLWEIWFNNHKQASGKWIKE